LSQSALQKANAAAEAKEWARAAQILEPAGDDTETLATRGFYLSRAGEVGAAATIYEDLARREPKRARWPYMVGYQLAEQERFSEAADWYERACRLDPSYLKAYYRLAQAEHRAGHEMRAQLAAAKVLRLWNESPDAEFRDRERVKMARASYLLGRAQLRRDPAGAVELLRQAVEHNPGDHHGHYLLGKALRRAGEPALAIAELRRAEEMKPRQSYQQVELAWSLQQAGRGEDARALLGRIGRHCRGWEALSAGRLALALGDPPLARELLDRAAKTKACRHHPLLQEARAQAQQAQANASPPSSGESEIDATRVGRIAVLRPERAFGFLVDEDGVRRHFRLRRDDLALDQRVRFAGFETEKGPAARDLAPLA